MSDLPPDYSPLTDEHIAALSDSQKEIFLQLDESDRQFFGRNFSPSSLSKALERKGAIMQLRLKRKAQDKLIQHRLATGETQLQRPALSAGEIAAGAAGVAGLVGVGVLARQIAPDGKAAWRGVSPDDLIPPLERAFARQEKTDLRFDPPNADGVRQGTIFLRLPGGTPPALTILLTPLKEVTQVQTTKVSSETLIETLKESGQTLLDLARDGLRLRRQHGDAGDLIDLAGKVVGGGADIAQTVKNLDLEDKAWEVVQRAAEPLQSIYDEKKAIEKELRLRLEQAWDDYMTCPKCRVDFGAEDAECRVCGAARPPRPEQPDPRTAIP
jgi:hypothetical protein